jgi:hypothetical protein
LIVDEEDPGRISVRAVAAGAGRLQFGAGWSHQTSHDIGRS